MTKIWGHLGVFTYTLIIGCLLEWGFEILLGWKIAEFGPNIKLVLYNYIKSFFWYSWIVLPLIYWAYIQPVNKITEKTDCSLITAYILFGVEAVMAIVKPLTNLSLFEGLYVFLILIIIETFVFYCIIIYLLYKEENFGFN